MTVSARSPKQSRGHATRRQIIEVARRFFSEHGYHHTGIADIHTASTLTKGAFYHHFRSKEDLALAVLEAATSDYAEQWIEPAMRRGSARERIEALLDGACALNTRPEWANCQMLATLSAELTVRDRRVYETLRTIQAGFFDLWRGLFTEADQAGELNEGIEPATAAQWVMSTMAGLSLARKLGTVQVPPQKLVAILRKALLRTRS